MHPRPLLPASPSFFFPQFGKSVLPGWGGTQPPRGTERCREPYGGDRHGLKNNRKRKRGQAPPRVARVAASQSRRAGSGPRGPSRRAMLWRRQEPSSALEPRRRLPALGRGGWWQPPPPCCGPGSQGRARVWGTLPAGRGPRVSAAAPGRDPGGGCGQEPRQWDGVSGSGGRGWPHSSHCPTEAPPSQRDPARREQRPLKQAPGRDQPHTDPANPHSAPRPAQTPLTPNQPLHSSCEPPNLLPRHKVTAQVPQRSPRCPAPASPAVTWHRHPSAAPTVP